MFNKTDSEITIENRKKLDKFFKQFFLHQNSYLPLHISDSLSRAQELGLFLALISLNFLTKFGNESAVLLDPPNEKNSLLLVLNEENCVAIEFTYPHFDQEGILSFDKPEIPVLIIKTVNNSSKIKAFNQFFRPLDKSDIRSLGKL